MRSTPLKLQEFSARSRSRPEPKPARSDLSTSLTLAAMSLGYGVVQLDVTIVNTALNSIGTSLGGGVSELQWVVSSYTIAFAAFILTAGALGDRIGAKRIFMAGFAIFNLVAARVTERIGAPATIAAGAALSALGCLALLGLEPGTSYWEIGAQLMIIGAGLGLLVPPLTSTLLGSVEKSHSGIAAGVLNSTRQTGSVVGVALFGSLAGQANAFMAGMHESLMISACLLLAAGAAIWRGATTATSS